MIILFTYTRVVLFTGTHVCYCYSSANLAYASLKSVICSTSNDYDQAFALMHGSIIILKRISIGSTYKDPIITTSAHFF